MLRHHGTMPILPILTYLIIQLFPVITLFLEHGSPFVEVALFRFFLDSLNISALILLVSKALKTVLPFHFYLMLLLHKDFHLLMLFLFCEFLLIFHLLADLLLSVPLRLLIFLPKSIYFGFDDILSIPLSLSFITLFVLHSAPLTMFV